MTHDGTGPLPSIGLAPGAPSDVLDAEVVALPFFRDGDDLLLGPGAADLVDVLGADLLGLLEHHAATGAAGEVVEHPVLPTPAASEAADEVALRSVLLVGIGAGEAGDLRRAGAAIARRVRDRGTVATSVPAAADDLGLRAFVEGLVLGSFTFHRRSTPGSAPAAAFVLAEPGTARSRQDAVDRGLAAARAGWLARALALTPANEKTPQWLAERSAEVAAGAGLDVRVWDEAALRKGGFGGIVGVGQASDNPPRLVQVGYTPAKSTRRTPHVVLVGKGITFDTGGLSIKPADAMMTMKRDMTGAGVVLAVLAELAELGCRVKVTGLLACAENSVSGRALRPGDVLRHYGGRTSEVTNTDAEGRLVMADALAYAVAELSPTVLVDVATLTGAMKVALGQRVGGVFANSDALAEQLISAAGAAGEPLWRMPLVDDYEERLESSIADADNAAGGPGAITAALFLQHFTGGLPWAHLDLASVGDSPVDAFEWSSGATGFGARLLLRWLGSDDPLAGLAAAPGGRRTTR